MWIVNLLNAKLTHAVRLDRIHFVVKMASVVITILYSMELMPMNVNVFALITSQVHSNIDYYMGKLMVLTHLIS